MEGTDQSYKSKDIAQNVSVSLYTSHIRKINKVVRSGKFKDVAKFLQYLVDDYSNRGKKRLIRDFLNYVGYPIIIVILLLYLSLVTVDRLIMYIAFGAGGLLMASVYSFFQRFSYSSRG